MLIGATDKNKVLYAKPALEKKYGIVEHGNYYTTNNPTPGTAIAFPVNATYDVTKPWFVFQNNHGVGGPDAYLDYLKLQVTVAAASGTSFNLAIWRDTIGAGALVTTDHLVNQAPVNVNGAKNIGTPSRFLYQTGATATVVGAMGKSAQLVACGSAGGLTIVSDELVFDFGGPQAFYSGLTAVQATAPGRKGSALPPLVVGPQQQLFGYIWALNNAVTGLSAEFEFTHWEM